MRSVTIGGLLLTVAVSALVLNTTSRATELTEVDTSHQTALGSGVINGDPFVEYQVTELHGATMEMRGTFCHIAQSATRQAKIAAIQALAEISLPPLGASEVSAETISKYLINDRCSSENDVHWTDVVLTGRVFTIFRGTKEFIVIESIGLVGATPSLLYFGRMTNRLEMTS